MRRDKLLRDMLLPPSRPGAKATLVGVLVPVCACNSRRGPLGGCCGACAGAIPDAAEEAVIRTALRRYDEAKEAGNAKG